MTTTKSLVFLTCQHCGPKSLHDYGVCRDCGRQNHASGQAPTVKPYPRNTTAARNYDAGAEEQGRARHAARAARHQLSRGRAR
jgi:hypothetical protein